MIYPGPMRGAANVWRGAAARLWAQLPRLIVVSLLWVAFAWPLLTLGAATLTAYAWLRRALLEVEDERRSGEPDAPLRPDEPYASLPRFAARLWWPGTLWAALNALVLLLVLGDLAVWRAGPGTLVGAVAGVWGLCLAWLWLAAQPFVLDALAEGLPLGRALGEAGRILLAYPLYCQLCALPPLLLLAACGWFTSLWPLAGAGLLLGYWAHVATGDPAPRRQSRIEEVL